MPGELPKSGGSSDIPGIPMTLKFADVSPDTPALMVID
jgi:hypothetical protein